MDRKIGQCVLVVSPNGNYAEVLSKAGDKLTVLKWCEEAAEIPLDVFEKLGAKPVGATRFPADDGYIYLAEGPGFWDLDLYAVGERHELRRKLYAR